MSRVIFRLQDEFTFRPYPCRVKGEQGDVSLISDVLNVDRHVQSGKDQAWHTDLVMAFSLKFEGKNPGVRIPGPLFNMKMTSYQYRKYHCGDKTVVRSSYLHNEFFYTGKMISLYWIRALVPVSIYDDMSALVQIMVWCRSGDKPNLNQ